MIIEPRRAWNIVWRTIHIAVSGVLVGGHVFSVPPERLTPILLLVVATGLVLMAIEAWPFRMAWLFEGRALMVFAKLAVLALIPFAWPQRVPLLFVVIAIASVGSHMPGRFRYYSIR